MPPLFATEFNDLAKLLINCLTTTDPTFKPLKYLDKFEVIKTTVDKVNFVYEDIKKYPTVFSKFTKDTKDDILALQHADSGKRKLNSGKYWEALEDFTRSVATAESERVRALAYGSRSECFVNLGMPDKCLEEINRALAHYPKELLDNLTERKTKAESMDVSVHKYHEPVPDDICSNRWIQCANDCLKIEQNDEFGRHIIAATDIQIGDEIAVEKPFTCVLTTDRLKHCHECLTLCYNPIPCNNCTVVLFCSESCKDKARAYHKYECPILLTICYRALCEFATDESVLLALKVALISKDDYPILGSRLSKETNSYRSDRYTEIHYLKTEAEFTRFDLFHQAILTALVFELLWNYTSFFSGIFSTADTVDKFKKVMFLQLQNTFINSAKIYEYVHKFDFKGTNNFGLGAYSFFSLFTHSCCANVMKTYHGSTMVLRALNTIKKGEQCFVNRYSLRYDGCPKSAREKFIVAHKLPECQCRACQEDWKPNLGDLQQICTNLGISEMNLGEIVRDVIGLDANKATQFLPDLIAQLKECESLEPEGNALALKNLMVHCYVMLGNKKIEFDDSQKNIVFEL